MLYISFYLLQTYFHIEQLHLVTWSQSGRAQVYTVHLTLQCQYKRNYQKAFVVNWGKLDQIGCREVTICHLPLTCNSIKLKQIQCWFVFSLKKVSILLKTKIFFEPFYLKATDDNHLSLKKNNLNHALVLQLKSWNLKLNEYILLKIQQITPTNSLNICACLSSSFGRIHCQYPAGPDQLHVVGWCM